VAGESIRAVAARLARAPSTISREIARNGRAHAIELLRRTKPLGSGHTVPSGASWLEGHVGTEKTSEDGLGGSEGWRARTSTNCITAMRAGGMAEQAAAADAQLLDELRGQIAELPSYGYRRACALVNRQRAQESAAWVNPKRAYWVMAQAVVAWSPSAVTRAGALMASRSNANSGEAVTTTFAKDCCDRENGLRAWEGSGPAGRARYARC